MDFTIFDVSKTPVSLLTQRSYSDYRNKKGKKQLYFGSKFGFSLTVFIFMVMIIYIVIMFNSVHNLEEDTYSTNILANKFDTEDNSKIDLLNNNFIPSIEIRVNENQESLDIIKDPEFNFFKWKDDMSYTMKSVNLLKLNQYLKFKITIDTSLAGKITTY